MLTTTAVKAHLRVEHDEDDTLIDNLTTAAYSYAERYTNTIILDTQKIDYLDDFADEITLKNTPVQSITTVTYYDTDDVQQSQSDYYLDTRKAETILKPLNNEVFPSTNGDYANVVITYQAGYSTIPKQIDQAVLLLIGSLYEQRENHVAGITMTKSVVSAEYLLDPYRVDTL